MLNLLAQAGGKANLHNCVMPKGIIGVDLSDEAANTVFKNHVPAASLKPKELWGIGKINKDGHSSNWTAIASMFHILSDILDITGGYIPKQKKLLNQFLVFLAGLSVMWAWKDADRCIQHLRCALQSLQSIVRSGNGRAPASQPKLQCLLDKMHKSEASTEKEKEIEIVAPTKTKKSKAIVIESGDSQNADESPSESEPQVCKKPAANFNIKDIEHNLFTSTSPSTTCTSARTPILHEASPFFGFKTVSKDFWGGGKTTTTSSAIVVAKIPKSTAASDLVILDEVPSSAAAVKTLDAKQLAALATQVGDTSAPMPKQYPA
jgi:hypothetical protein